MPAVPSHILKRLADDLTRDELSGSSSAAAERSNPSCPPGDPLPGLDEWLALLEDQERAEEQLATACVLRMAALPNPVLRSFLSDLAFAVQCVARTLGGLHQKAVRPLSSDMRSAAMQFRIDWAQNGGRGHWVGTGHSEPLDVLLALRQSASLHCGLEPAVRDAFADGLLAELRAGRISIPGFFRAPAHGDVVTFHFIPRGSSRDDIRNLMQRVLASEDLLPDPAEVASLSREFMES